MYKGRFAPSPTGPLHFGSLVAALASYLDARASQGIWQLRIDDIDPPRHDPKSFTSIPECLRRHGLVWDNAQILQSARRASHEQYLQKLRADNRVFTCICTRSTLGSLSQCEAGCGDRRYEQGSIRLKMESALPVAFTDLVMGEQSASNLPTNFVVKRKDGLIAYQLATAVDDVDEGYTHVVRGRDLLDSTFRQIIIQRALGKSSPRYAHIPLVTDVQGNKLSKQTSAPAVNDETPVDNLRAALIFLNQKPPSAEVQSVDALLDHAIRHWDITETQTVNV